MICVGPAVDSHGARRRAVQAQDEPHGRRLAGAVRPEEAGDHARPDSEVEAVYGGLGAVAFGQLARLDHAGSLIGVTRPRVETSFAGYSQPGDDCRRAGVRPRVDRRSPPG